MPKLITVEDMQPSSGSESQPPENPPSSATDESVSRSGYDRHQSQLIIRTASRIGLHMLREDIVHDAQNTAGMPAPNHIQQEHFVINSCKVFIGLDSKEPLERGWLLLSPQQRQEILGSIQTSLPQEILKNPVPYLDFYGGPACSESVKTDAQNIFQKINSKREMGILVSDFPQAIGNLSCTTFTLEQHIQILLNCRAVIKVGVLASRYVVSQFITPWVIQSFRLLRSGKEKLVPFDANKVSKQSEEGASEVLAEEENSSMRGDTIPSDDASNDDKSVKAKQKDQGATHGTEAWPIETTEPSDTRSTEELHAQTSINKESPNETGQNDSTPPSNEQENITARRKRRISTTGNPSVKRAKTIDTLGDE